MRVSIVGSGYVGTTVAACFADAGHRVTAIDIDEAIVASINRGEPPIHEPGLDELVTRHAGDRLVASEQPSAAAGSEVVLLALPTPSREDGAIDLGAVEAGARSIGDALRYADGRPLVVVKSTVVPGSTEGQIARAIAEGADVAVEDLPSRFGLAMNPEFLREGSAVEDFRRPDKVVFGTAPDDDRARDRLEALYEPVIGGRDVPIIHTGVREAEMIKYANNAFLAAKVSLINELGNVCKAFDVDAYEVAEAMGLDDRIGARFLRSGVGWGGSCFGKDVAALIAAARSAGYEPSMLPAAVAVNEEQPRRMVRLLERHLEPEERTVAVLGLAFKPGTDDVRDSRAIAVIEALIERGARVVAYDPAANDRMRERFPGIEYADSAAEALEGAHAALVVTDWEEFAALGEEFEAMARPIVIDGRRVIDPPAFVTYEGMTW